MGKKKRKKTMAEKRRKGEYMTIFVHGKQKRVKRSPTVDGIPVDEFIKRNADPIWLHQNGMHEVLQSLELEEAEAQPKLLRDFTETAIYSDDMPF